MNTILRTRLFALGIAHLMAWAPACAAGADPARPNVIVIMADDLGAEGLGCYGSTIYSTPHLDRMAADGVRFNNAYATPLCTPTRVMADMDIKGGKASMTEAGTRVPLLAWWPGTIKPGVREQLFCLADVLPTITSVAGIPLSRQLDGMDLSHVLLGKEGKDREQVFINYGRGFFVRESRFRLNQDGKLYDIPATSDKERYGNKVTTDPAHEAARLRLQAALDQFMAIKSEISPELKGGKKSKTSKGKPD